MTGALTGKHILVVEDEYFIASDLKRALMKEGAIILGPVGTLGAALPLTEEPIDAAVLDVNLGQAMSYPIADRLRALGVPYMFLTGYDGWSLPAEYRDVPRLPKPFTPHSVVAMVEKLIAAAEEDA